MERMQESAKKMQERTAYGYSQQPQGPELLGQAERYSFDTCATDDDLAKQFQSKKACAILKQALES